jgi:ABC-type transport system involved in multi-copper enzyme maturation permease subunit
VKPLIIASKDIKMHLKSPKFIFSIPLSSSAIIGLRILFDSLHITPITINPIFLMDVTFTLTLPCMGLALLLSNADIIARERSEGTILILFSQPISNTSIILGKFIATLFSGIIYIFTNILLLRILHPYMFEISGFITEGQLISSLLLAELIFILPIIGLTILFSLIFRRSVTVTIMVILIYETLAILYSSQLTLTLTLPIPLGVRRELIQILVILLGSILGYMMYTLGQLTPLTIKEPPLIKYIPINVNAQRLLHFLISPSPTIQISEIIISVSSLIAITMVTITLSLLLIKRARSEHLD